MRKSGKIDILVKASLFPKGDHSITKRDKCDILELCKIKIV